MSEKQNETTYPVHLFGGYTLEVRSGSPVTNPNGYVLYWHSWHDSNSPPGGWIEYAWFEIPGGTQAEQMQGAIQKSSWTHRDTISYTRITKEWTPPSVPVGEVRPMIQRPPNPIRWPPKKWKSTHEQEK